MRRALAVSLLLVMVSAPTALGQSEEATVDLLVPTAARTEAFGVQGTGVSDVGWKRITVPVRGTVEETRRSLERELGVRVLPERRYRLLDGSDEPGFDQQWSLENLGQDGGTPGADIDAARAWKVATGSGVVVAVIDSGVDASHPELDEQIWHNPGETVNGKDDDGNDYVDDVSGWDFIAGDRDPFPGGSGSFEAHGTLVAGIIAAEVNGTGIAGVAPDARVMNLRACSQGDCLTLDATRAIYYAVDNGADIINLSFGAPFPENELDPPLEQAIDYARRHDVLVVTAGGNTPPDQLQGYIMVPAELPFDNNVAVASTNRDDVIDIQSYYGDNIDIAAPGVDILSTSPTGYAIATGTSFATPHVAGVAALLLSSDPGIGHQELAARIKAWAENPPGVAGRVESGRVDAGRALNKRFVDTVGTTFEADVDWAASEEVTQGCDPPENIMFCPEDAVTRGQVAAFLKRFLGLPATSGNYFTDDNGTTFENDIDRLAAAGITKGCNPPDNDHYCPDDPVTRGQMAALIVRALGLESNDHPGFDDVSATSTFYTDIGKLATAGITRGCNPPANDQFCPDDVVTRGQMAAFLHRASVYR